MNIKQKLFTLKNIISHIRLRVAIPAGVGLICLSLLSGSMLIAKQVRFSYAGSTCVPQLTLLPEASKPTDDSGFDVSTKKMVTVAGVKIASLETCFTAKKAPSVGLASVSVGPDGGWLKQKTFIINIPQPPTAQLDVLTKPISTAKSLDIPLTESDEVFQYRLTVDQQTTECPVKNAVLHCDIAALKLTQGKTYELHLTRLFNNQQAGTVIKKNINTLVATSVISSSIAEAQVVYDKPKQLTVTFDKDIVRADVSLSKLGTEAPVLIEKPQVNGKQMLINVTNDLERSASYELSATNLEAKDGSTLADSHIVSFTTSGGPKVTGINTPAYGLALNKTIAISFDQPLSKTQDVVKFVNVKGISATVSRSINQILVTYVGAPACTDFSVSVASGIESQYGVLQTAGWSQDLRTICQSVSTIGYSLGGRAIQAYTFGSGSKTILYTGAIHGNELSSRSLMLAWINELEFNVRSIPAGTKVVVIPAVNPDGVATNVRNNAANVDLNRNFPTSDWQTDIVSPTNQPIPGGGGATALSELESQALASFTIALQPRLVMSFHSQAGYAMGNQAGDSAALAATYAKLSGYKNTTGSTSAFGYAITGSYDDWLAEIQGITSVLVELTSNTNSEFSRNKTALWAMARS